MTRERLSREQTTLRLLDAAEKLIARHGLGGASLEDIAAAAGFSRGAFYSNFSNKNEMFIELLQRDLHKSRVHLNALRSDDLSVEQIHRRVRGLCGQLLCDNASAMNWTEARILAARDVSFRVELNALIAERSGQIAALLQFFHDRTGSVPSLSPKILAAGLMSLADGMALFMMSNPAEMTPAGAESLLCQFVDFILNVRSLGDGRVSR